MPNQIGYIRVSKNTTEKVASFTFEGQYQLNLLGVDGPEDAPLVFGYEDKETGLLQKFGVSI
jgi:hypothetical protein